MEGLLSLECVSEGSFASVYKTVTAEGLSLAIKIIPKKSEEQGKLVEREALICETVNGVEGRKFAIVTNF